MADRRRRGAWAVFAALAGGALLWFVSLPAYRPALQAQERYGVDVSLHQGVIDWRRVAADGVSFAYIKATEGGDHTDPLFAGNWERAARAGLQRGAYHAHVGGVQGSVDLDVARPWLGR